MQSKKPPRARFDCAQRASFDAISFRSGRSLPSPTLQRETTKRTLVYISLLSILLQSRLTAK
jgi:hypothetical protein